MTVIGPISFEHWFNLRQLHTSIKHMEKINKGKYKIVIEKEKKQYEDILGLYKEAA